MSHLLPSEDDNAAERSPATGAAASAAPLVPHPSGARASELISGSSRQQAARRLLTTGANPALDHLAELAARLLGTPAAQVSLLSDVQTISAVAGLDPAVVGSSSPLADSLCTVTAVAGAPLVVADAAQDVRVATLPPVVTGAVGAYLGVPLRGQDGHVVGALCVFSPAPRPWSAADVALLSDLAAAAVTELELSALTVEYEAERLRWQLAIAAGGVGSFDWNLITGVLAWDERLIELFGYDADTFDRSIEAFNARLHPDDLPRVTEALEHAISTCGEYEAEYRIVLPGGQTRWIQARGKALADEHGVATRVLGAAYDTTMSRDADARVARVLETMSTAFFSLDRAWRFTYVNAHAEQVLGRSRQELLGGQLWELFPAAVGSDFEVHYRAVAETGEPAAFEAYYPPPLDAWYEVRAWPDPAGMSVYFLEITERKRVQERAEAAQQAAEETQRRLAVALHAADAAHRRAESSRQAVERLAERLRLLVRVSEDLSATLDAEEAVARLAQHLVPTLGDWCIITLVDEHGALRDVGSWHAEQAQRAAVEQYCQARLIALRPSSYLHRAWRTGRSVSLEQDATEAIAEVLEAGDAHEALLQLAPESALFLPLRARGRTVGLVSLFRGPSRGALPADDRLTASEVADRAGLALDNARLYTQQQRMAEGLQRSLLTAPVEPDHLEVAVRYQPAAEAAQVGGDWYDAFLQPDGATVLVIGDVMGHDITAAAAMSQVRSLLRGIAYATGAAPAAVLSGLDAAMQGLQVDTTATAVVARIEQSQDERARDITRLRWSNAGHPPPMLLTPDGTVTALAGHGPDLLLGVSADYLRADSAITVDRGSTVLLYTDGLVERRGQPLDQGINRLRQVVTELAGESLEVMLDGILTQMLPAHPEDDVALVAVRLHPHERPRPPEAGPRRVPARRPHVL
ncbi:SpoIIE family protein phosphatase [Kineococcus glutinatus]|uniref:PAS domain S-box-containing protein n=1 Tax=Kineococcus glutinatus TaxID=1070872 RepID=A0ABP9HFB9_9ACTN